MSSDAVLAHQRVGVGVDGLLVEGVDLGDGGRATGLADLFGDALQLLQRAAGEVHGGALAGERAGDGAADVAAASVDDCVLAFQQHAGLLIVCRRIDLSRRRDGRELIA